MINLLPPKEKEELLFQKKRNLVIVLGSMTVISLVCLSLVLLSLKFYVLQQVIYKKAILQSTQKEYQTADFLALKNYIQKYNTTLNIVDNFYKKEIYFSDALKTIVGIERPSGIYFTSVAIEKSKTDNNVKITIYGTSNTRDELVLFKHNIESNNNITNAYFPPDSWIKPTNVNFYVTFEKST